MRIPIWLLSFLEFVLPARKLIVVEDEMPSKLPRRSLLLLRDSGEDWSVTMRCPCGCGENIELALIPEAKPRWELSLEQGIPTLKPSVWKRDGCYSHFFLRRGRVIWVR